MMNRKLINEEQARYAMEHGEFDKEIITSKDKVVVVLTQNWCPQWKDVASWIYDVETDEEFDVYELEYNKVHYFDEFRNFKEQVWNNDQVPYLRFYHDGRLVKETNYISRAKFIEILGL